MNCPWNHTRLLFAVCANKHVKCDFLEATIFNQKISIPQQSEEVKNAPKLWFLLLMVQTLIQNIPQWHLRNVLLLLPNCRLIEADRRNCIVTHLLQTEQSISTTIFYFHISLLHFFCDMINCQKSLANLFPVYPARDFLIYLRRAVANQRCANCWRCFCFWHADRQLHYQSLSTNSQLDTLEFCSLTGQPVD